LPNGTFTTTITDDDLVKGHATRDIPENHGTFTLLLKDGFWRLHQQAPNPLQNPSAGGRLRVTGDRVVFVTYKPLEFAGSRDVLRWSFDGTRLRFHVIVGGPEEAVVFGAHPWEKVG